MNIKSVPSNKSVTKTQGSENSSKLISSADSITLDQSYQSLTKVSNSSEKESDKIRKIRMICKFIGNEDISKNLFKYIFNRLS